MSYQVTAIEPGMTFGRLTVLCWDHREKRKTYYRCACECGKETVVFGHFLKTGKTKSCGCLRSDSMAMVRGNKPRVKVSERTKRWIINHYKHTKNKDIMEKYGLSEGWLHRFAREHGLKKTPRFMKACQTATTKAAAFSHFINGTYPPKGYRIPRSDANCFKPGVTNLQRFGKKGNAERIRKSAETRRRTWKLEHARMTFGLPRETKLRVFRQPKDWTSKRYYLRKHGYVVERGALDAYYTDETERNPSLEERYKPFRFHPINEREG